MFQGTGRRIFWVGLGSLGVGFGAISAAHWDKGPKTSTEASGLRALPLNLIGVTAYYVSSIPIPEPLRETAFKSYCSAVGCDVNNVSRDIRSFRSISDFFGRTLRPETRPIDKVATLIAPCDGTVLEAGPVGAYGAIEVKNVKYRIRELVGAGEREPLAESSVAVADREESGSRLWYTVIHIGPGQCHRFASPTAWNVAERRHIEGHLFWMNPEIDGLYTQNERVAIVGRWEHGLFVMTAVGAAGRGSITLELEEGENFHPRIRPKLSRVSTLKYSTEKAMKPGQPLGGFRLGSAIVLVFEAPEQSFKFHVQSGEKVQFGQKLATLGVQKQSSKNRPKMSKPEKANAQLSTRDRFRRAW